MKSRLNYVETMTIEEEFVFTDETACREKQKAAKMN